MNSMSGIDDNRPHDIIEMSRIRDNRPVRVKGAGDLAHALHSAHCLA